MTAMDQQPGGGGGTTGPGGGGGGGNGSDSSMANASADDASLMNPMLGSQQQQSNLSNGLDLGQQMQQQQQQQGQSSSLLSPSLQMSKTGIPEIILSDFSSSAGSEFTKEVLTSTFNVLTTRREFIELSCVPIHRRYSMTR